MWGRKGDGDDSKRREETCVVCRGVHLVLCMLGWDGVRGTGGIIVCVDKSVAKRYLHSLFIFSPRVDGSFVGTLYICLRDKSSVPHSPRNPAAKPLLEEGDR